jgi:hypothetical protein
MEIHRRSSEESSWQAASLDLGGTFVQGLGLACKDGRHAWQY